MTNENFQNVDLTKERLKRQIRLVKADTQRHYMMFFSKIANEKRERIEHEKTKYELDERIYKLIDYLERIRQKTEIIDGKLAGDAVCGVQILRSRRIVRSIANHRRESIRFLLSPRSRFTHENEFGYVQ